MTPPIRVIKLGGSLWSYPLLRTRLAAWRALLPAAVNLWLCGGGAAVEAIREADRLHGLDERAAHWLCLQIMDVKARLLATLLDDLPVTNNPDDALAAAARGEHADLVLAPFVFLRDREPDLAGRRLPQSWAVTSDSVAARLAETIGAPELVLLKSRQPPAPTWTAPPSQTGVAAGVWYEELAEAGYVDRHFAAAASGIPRVAFVCLRDA